MMLHHTCGKDPKTFAPFPHPRHSPCKLLACIEKQLGSSSLASLQVAQPPQPAVHLDAPHPAVPQDSSLTSSFYVFFAGASSSSTGPLRGRPLGFAFAFGLEPVFVF